MARFQFHAPGGFWPVLGGGISAALYCFVWLYLPAAGAGPSRRIPRDPSSRSPR